MSAPAAIHDMLVRGYGAGSCVSSSIGVEHIESRIVYRSTSQIRDTLLSCCKNSDRCDLPARGVFTCWKVTSITIFTAESHTFHTAHIAPVSRIVKIPPTLILFHTKTDIERHTARVWSLVRLKAQAFRQHSGGRRHRRCPWRHRHRSGDRAGPCAHVARCSGRAP